MKRLYKAIAYGCIATFYSLVIYVLNLFLDQNALSFVSTFQEINNKHFILPTLLVLGWYLILFSALFLIAFAVQEKLEKEKNIKISIWFLVLPFLSLLIIRSIIMEPYLYQTFYTALWPFKLVMDGLLIFDLKPVIDLILLVTIIATTLFLILRQAFIVIGLILLSVITVSDQNLQYDSASNNGKTVLLIMADSLRKDYIENNPELFLHDLFNKSTVIKNMYTVFPASVPSMAGVYSNKYPYEFRATALSLDKPLNLNFVQQLKQDYKLSLHTDFTDEIGYRKNFNIPFDEVHATNIDFQSIIVSNALLKNVILMALINNDLRPTLLPQFYAANNTNSKQTVNSAIKYLAKNRQDNKIASIFLGDTHIPFRAEYPYYRPFIDKNDSPNFKWSFDYEDYIYNGELVADNQNIQNLYLITVLRLDDHIKNLITLLERQDLLTNTTTVIFSDQGENLFDENLNIYSHNNIDTKHVINVPFAIYRPNRPAQVISEGNYSILDTINLALHPDNITDFAQSEIYIEADFDVHDPNNPLYAEVIGKTILDTNDLNNIVIKDNESLQQYKRRALIQDNFILTYEPIKNPPFGLYNLDSDPLFLLDIKSEKVNIFNQMRQNLEKYIAETKKY